MVIRKRISLDFLGEDYKEAYLEFKGIALKEFEKYIKQAEELEKKGGTESIRFIFKTLKDHYLSGKFPDESKELKDVPLEELEDLDVETAIKVFSLLTGQELSPK